jgi:hypothetical protein
MASKFSFLVPCKEAANANAASVAKLVTASLDSVYFDIGCCYINLSNLSVSCWSWISGNAPQFCRSKWRRLFLIICLFALQRPASQQDHAERSDMVTTYALYGH